MALIFPLTNQLFHAKCLRRYFCSAYFFRFEKIKREIYPNEFTFCFSLNSEKQIPTENKIPLPLSRYRISPDIFTTVWGVVYQTHLKEYDREVDERARERGEKKSQICRHCSSATSCTVSFFPRLPSLRRWFEQSIAFFFLSSRFFFSLIILYTVLILSELSQRAQYRFFNIHLDTFYFSLKYIRDVKCWQGNKNICIWYSLSTDSQRKWLR